MRFCIKSIYAIGIVFSIFCTSCKKYLDVKSNNAQVVPQNIQDFQGLMDDVALMNMQTPDYGEACADDYFLTPQAYQSISYYSGIAAYTWAPFDYYFNNEWSDSYLTIYNANTCLEGIQNVPVTSDNLLQRNNIIGSALFYRAYNILNLLWDFAKAYDSSTARTDLGVVLRMTTNFNVPSTRASVEACYHQVITDAMQSVNDLPEFPQYLTRPSKAASYGLLARTYLSMRNYDSAFKYANLCLNIKGNLVDYNTLDTTSSTPFTPFNDEIIFYSEEENDNLAGLTNPSYNAATIDTSLYESYSDNDLRKAIYFMPNSGYHSFKGSYSASNADLFSGLATDEIYLIRAECYARMGDKEDALNDLNTLLKMRYQSGYFSSVTAVGAQDALDTILVERRKELVMRGLRWMDIKRLNKEGRSIVLTRVVSGKTYTLSPNDPRYALPLPTDIIQNSHLQQN